MTGGGVILELPGAAMRLADAGPGRSQLFKGSAAPVKPSLISLAETLITVARDAQCGDHAELVSRIVNKISDELVAALVAEPEHDASLRVAMTVLLAVLKEFAEADARRRPAWGRAIAQNLATVRELYHIAVRS